MRYTSALTAFHRMIGHPVATAPQILEAEALALRLRLLQEERDELVEALLAYDLVRVVDALADVLVVVYGTAVASGVSLPNALSVPPHPFLLNHSDNFSRCEDLVGYLDADMQAFAEAYTPLDAQEALRSMVEVLQEAMASLGVSLAPVMQEVHRSNMSKWDGYRREDGKWMKGPSYAPPDIAGVLRSQGWRGGTSVSRR